MYGGFDAPQTRVAVSSPVFIAYVFMCSEAERQRKIERKREGERERAVLLLVISSINFYCLYAACSTALWLSTVRGGRRSSLNVPVNLF